MQRCLHMPHGQTPNHLVPPHAVPRRHVAGEIASCALQRVGDGQVHVPPPRLFALPPNTTSPAVAGRADALSRVSVGRGQRGIEHRCGCERRLRLLHFVALPGDRASGRGRGRSPLMRALVEAIRGDPHLCNPENSSCSDPVSKSSISSASSCSLQLTSESSPARMKCSWSAAGVVSTLTTDAAWPRAKGSSPNSNSSGSLRLAARVGGAAWPTSAPTPRTRMVSKDSSSVGIS